MSLIEPLPVKILRLAKTHWRKIVVGVFLLLFVVFAVLAFRSCGKSVEFDHETVNRINNQNAAVAKEEIRAAIEKNIDVIKTVDGRTELVNLTVEERDKEIARIVAEASAKTEAAKQIKGDVTGPELECILLPSECQ